MFVHCVFTGACYRLKKWVAIDQVFKLPVSEEEVGEFKDKVFSLNTTNIPLSSHMISLESDTIEDLKEDDLFFTHFEFKETVGGFIHDIQLDTDLTSVDVGKYILSKFDCSHLPLQKLVYFCHAEYLQETGKPLFSDNVYAFNKGPVEELLWEKFHHQKPYTANLKQIAFGDSVDRADIIMRGRLFNAEDGFRKIKVIDRTLNALKHKNGPQLIELTHRPGSPWSRIYQENEYHTVIPNDVIKEFHEIEKPQELIS